MKWRYVHDWAKAEASLLLQGPLDPDRVSLRVLLCRSCDWIDPSPDEKEIGWCRKCGCAKSDRSTIARKATMPGARCPISRWEQAERRSQAEC